MFRILFILPSLALFSCAPLSGQILGESEASDSSQILDSSVIPSLQTAFNMMTQEEYEAALSILDELITREREDMKPFDLATTLEIRGSVKMSLGDYDGAIDDFNEVLALGALPEPRLKQLELLIRQTNSERDNPPARQPMVRVPPQFPARCIKDGGGQIEEFVELMFDIADDGSVNNIRVVDVSGECFVRAAKASVSKWQFEPQIEAGESVAIADQTTRITFYYSGE